MKAPGIKHLKLKYDKSLSKFAFKFSWRRYTKAPLTAAESGGRDGGHGNGRDIGCARGPGDAKRLRTEGGGGGRSGGGGGLHSSTFQLNLSRFRH